MHSKCPHCGAGLKTHQHNLSVNLGKSLVALYKNAGIGKPSELKLTHSQINNFQKLKYWNFIQKADDSWEITSRGIDFVQGGSAPKSVKTFRNETIEVSEETITLCKLLPEITSPQIYAARSERYTGSGKLF